MVKAKWLASLSNGMTAIEGTPPFHVIPGELSPWLRLQEYLKEHDVHITGMRLQVERAGEPVKTYNLPSYRTNDKSGKHERWNFIKPLKPLRYNYGRVAEATWGSSATGPIGGAGRYLFISP